MSAHQGNLNEIREQLSEDQRKRSNRKKANLRCYSNEGDIENTATNTIKRQNRLMTCLQVIGILNGEQIASDRDDTIEGYIFHIKRGKIYEVTGRLTKSQPLAFVIKDRPEIIRALRGVTCSKKGTIGIVVGNGFTPGAIEEANLSLKNIQLS
ncbi:hypothetical protein C2G38_2207042 [Gigaspora rosea]|uniref:Uncharacterized protein n=1 Tax=Gigaspora rosea TaxID=44941 RepID=A0A397ULS1_9GLOM|nr:hypothetical protein C2G38_2207042 [Gigaspora rosea]